MRIFSDESFLSHQTMDQPNWMDSIMSRSENHSRRQFLTSSAAVTLSLGAGVFVGNSLFADPTQLASRVDNAPESHPLIPALQMGTAALKALDEVKDYTATFTKREMIGQKLVDSKMEMKFRHKPFSVYLKFIKPVAGREVLYVEGQNDSKIKAHDVGFAGLAGTLTLDVDGSFAMADNRHPITMIGMQMMVSEILEQWLKETKMSDMTVNFYPKARIGTVSCKAIETSHRKQVSGAKHSMTRLYVESSTGLPIRVQQFDFPSKNKKKPVLVEDYLYSDVKTNVDLKDSDFSTSNSSYRF